MTSRCPRCGKNNYGDVQKCSFCGSPLVFIPGEEIVEISQEDIQEKMDNMKIPRMRNPFLIGSGGAVTVIGMFIAVAVFLIVMLVVFDPGDVEPYYNDGLHYKVPGGEEYIFGEITNERIDSDTPWIDGVSHGYADEEGNAYIAYQIGGTETDNRPSAQNMKDAAREPDTWIYSDEDLGNKGDKVLIKVEIKTNEFGEARAVYKNRAWWGSSGWFSGGWIFALPGILISLAGGAILIIGIVGKADRSMERLMEGDKELRRQQIMLRQAARKKMEEKQRSQQWSDYGTSPQITADEQDGQNPEKEVVPPTAIPQEMVGSEQAVPGQVPTQPEYQARAPQTEQYQQSQPAPVQPQAPPPVTGQPPQQQ